MDANARTRWRALIKEHANLFRSELEQLRQEVGPIFSASANSPIFYAEHVETPVLIIQGDMDFVPIQRGEEFFMAMYRRGKRARFLRYWTGGHGTGGANAIDMWKQIYAWFDEFLMKPEKTEGGKQ